MDIVVVLSSAGFLISLYILFVERSISGNPTYKPFCDISDRVSCTKPLRSDYKSIFGISNSLTGMVFYFILICAALLNLRTLILGMVAVLLVATIFLAYLLYVRMRVFCILCTSIYIINILLFLSVFYPFA